jgi:bifunctional NMN adenylyltransferase/nudix hydrolase
MDMEIKTKETEEVGVVIGRFQCSYVHEGYEDLFNYVLTRHPRVMVFLGCSPLKGPQHDPLPFWARREMIEEAFPDIEVYKMDDVGDVDRWSKILDRQIDSVIGPMQKVVLYGSRDKFKYTGKHKLVEVPCARQFSSTAIRKELGIKPQNDRKWREGVIYNSQNRFPVVYPTVDIAAIDLKAGKVLLGRKPGEALWRFPGGFAEKSTPSYEIDALRELQEETQLQGTALEYIGSQLIDDWRYRNQPDKIKTLFYAVTAWNGMAKADDDLEEVEWKYIDTFSTPESMMKNHQILWTMLLNWREKILARIEQFKKTT